MHSFFKTHCREDWPNHYCDLGNACALFAQLIGFTAILPQIYQIWTYRSVDALHVFWPTALVTSAFANTFYIFATEHRSVFKVAAIYFPLVYMIFLLEFWLFTRKSSQRRLSYAAMCIILWACVLTIELTVSRKDGPGRLEWIAIVLYSVKVLPQVLLNVQLRTTFGQSSISVLLCCLATTFSFLSVYLLQEKLQYRVMYYLSSSLAYINAIQVVWYPKPKLKKEKPICYGTIIDSQDYSVPFEERNAMVTTITEEVIESPSEIDQITKPSSSSKETSYGSSAFGISQTLNATGYFQRLKEKSWLQLFLLAYLFGAVAAFTVGLGVTVNTFWSVFGPLSMFGIMFVTSLFRDYNEGTLQCYYCIEIKYRIWGDSM